MFNSTQECKMAKNVVNCNGIEIKITGKNRPFGNDFEQLKSVALEVNGQQEIAARVKCIGGREPGRIYDCYYSMRGLLMECNTVN
jgi:hypothetical protein